MRLAADKRDPVLDLLIVDLLEQSGALAAGPELFVFGIAADHQEPARAQVRRARRNDLCKGVDQHMNALDRVDAPGKKDDLPISGQSQKLPRLLAIMRPEDMVVDAGMGGVQSAGRDLV